jgi:GntR family transcriptional repressor for pyruvate dehydrogenase complex
MSSAISRKEAKAPGTAAPLLPAIHAPKASELLAVQLRRQILEGALADGVTLPSERELGQQTGLSRGAVRQALQSLQAEGLIETRTGRFGGSIVRRPSDDALAKFLGLFIQGRSIPLMSLLQFREMMGGPIAALAAANRLERDIQLLELIGQRQEAALYDLPVYLAENVKWQVAMAAATHNELITAIITAISGLIFKATSIENFASEEIRKLVVKSHRTILDAVTAQDCAAASRRMNRHLSALTRDMQAFENAPETVD